MYTGLRDGGWGRRMCGVEMVLVSANKYFEVNCHCTGHTLSVHCPTAGVGMVRTAL